MTRIGAGAVAGVLVAALGASLVAPRGQKSGTRGRGGDLDPTEFVGRDGTRFVLGGKPFEVAGTHVHYLPWGTRAEVDRALEDADAMGFNVVRFFITSFRGSPDGVTQPTIWGWPFAPDSANMAMNGVYTCYWDPQRDAIGFNDNQYGFGRVDYVIQKAGELGLRLDVAFMDFWQYAGGSQQIRAWYGNHGDLGPTGIEPPVNGGDPRDRYSFFFRDERCRADYRALVRHVLERRNPLTGVLYKDDPTIFAWDLMNEPQMIDVELAMAWKREMAAFVKSIDPDHLLCTGAEGFYERQGGNAPAAELTIPEIDFGTWHTYPAYHQIEPEAVLDLIRRHAEDARTAGKPVLLQEFGYGSREPDQIAVYQSWLDQLRDEPDSAGWVHWRLTSRMDDGDWAEDNGEQFDVHNDDGPLARLLKQSALRQRSRGAAPAGR